MPRKTKYVKGRYINDIGTLADIIRPPDRHYVFMRDRATHPAWVRSMSLEYLEMQVSAGNVRQAIERDGLVEVVCDHAVMCAEAHPDSPYHECPHRQPHLPQVDERHRGEDLCWELHTCPYDPCHLCRCVPPDGIWPDYMQEYNAALARITGGEPCSPAD